MKKILIVGAGAIGQVYGYHLSKTGHQITFLIKEKYQTAVAKGFTLYHLNRDPHQKKPIRFNNFQIITDLKQAQEVHWNQVYLCISSTALHAFDLSNLKSILAANTTVIALQPAPHDYHTITQHLSSDRVVQGLITLLSFNTASLNQSNQHDHGTAYWIPPLAAMPFAGPRLRRREVIRTFKASKLPARNSKNLYRDALYATAVFNLFICALEIADWQFENFKKDRVLQKRLVSAINQAMEAISATEKVSIPFWKHLVNAHSIRLLSSITSIVAPLDLEAFYKVHFTKVKQQTLLIVESYLKMAQQSATPADDLLFISENI